ncbi:LL-diaminopimelate aminotransferase [subsurface metagenome]
MVPFCFQSELSRVNDQEFHDIVWYKKVINLPENFKKKRILLHFGAVDYLCRVYLNGEYIGSHEGGYIGFSLDITDFVEKENYLVIRVEDPSTDNEIPRGKQYWRKENAGIFYSRVTGIWQTVWIDCVDLNFYLRKVKIMWVNYPHMPTGAIPSKDLFRNLVDFGHKHKILICHDNPYSLDAIFMGLDLMIFIFKSRFCLRMI